MTLIEDWSMRGPSKFNDEALLFGGDAGGVAAGGLLVNPNHRGIGLKASAKEDEVSVPQTGPFFRWHEKGR